jgi:hypothetical protein
MKLEHGHQSSLADSIFRVKRQYTPYALGLERFCSKKKILSYPECYLGCFRLRREV